MLSKFKLNQLYFKDTQFANLMTRRIFNVLLIANPYDAFMLEDDGRIDEKIFNEYTSTLLALPSPFHAGFHLRGGADTAVLHLFRPHHLHAGHGRQRQLRRGTIHQKPV